MGTCREDTAASSGVALAHEERKLECSVHHISTITTNRYKLPCNDWSSNSWVLVTGARQRFWGGVRRQICQEGPFLILVARGWID